MLKKAPDIVEMLKKMTIGLDTVNELLLWSKQEQTEDWEKVAIHFFKNYDQKWRQWVTEDAYNNIKTAIDAFGSESN